MFRQFKDAHMGESCVLFGTGPTLRLYVDDKDIVKIGSNEMVFSDISLDYYFIGDSQPKKPEKYLEKEQFYIDYKPRIQKFVRFQNWSENGRMPTYLKHSIYYKGALSHKKRKKFKKDIHVSPFLCCCSISFEMFQFALYTGVSKIYLVGQDCDYSKGTFATPSDTDKPITENDMLKYWKLAKIFASENYPDVEIYSVNPVGLTGVFETVEQERMA
jgi:hypothetical protein